MKRLATGFSRLLLFFIVSITVLKGTEFIADTIRPISSAKSSIATKSTILFASAQEYSTIEERIYIAESFIDQNGREKEHGYARVESYTIDPQYMPHQPHITGQQQVQYNYNQETQQQNTIDPYQQERIGTQPGQQQFLQQRDYLPPVHPVSSSQPQIHHSPNLNIQNGQQHQQTAPDYSTLHQDHRQQSPAFHQEALHSVQYPQADFKSQPEAPISSTQPQMPNVDALQNSMKSQVGESPQSNDNRQYHYAHTQIEWRRESTDRGELNEFYLSNHYKSAIPSFQSNPLSFENHVTSYIQYHQQLHHHSDIPQLKIDQHYQNLAKNPHGQQLGPHQQKSEYMYSRQISDSDYEAAHQYYYNGHNVDSHGPFCEPVDDSTVLILPDQYGRSTCRAASKLGDDIDPSTAAAQATTDSFSAHVPSRNSNVESFPMAPHHYHYESSLMSAIRHYWREVSGLCLASAIFLNWLFVVVKRKFIAASGLATNRAESVDEALPQLSSASTSAQPTKSSSKDTNNTNSAHDSAFEENASPVSLDDVESSSTQSSSSDRDRSTHSLRQHETNRQRSVSPVLRQRSSTLKADCCPSSGHASLSQSNSLSTTILNTSEYISRYSSDFDSIQRLGRGGFGIVFEARNKIDDCHYAVKRICLPLEKEARERVMREVRALAKLDHAGIVRYYNAWLETPPDDWLKKHDAQLGIVNSRDGASFPSTDGIYDRGESEIHDKTKGRGAKVNESGDYSSDWFGTNNNRSSLRQRRINGYNNKFLRNNSSSPSLDIVFEGSGSIRLEAENITKQTDSSHSKLKPKNDNKKQGKKGSGDTNNSDSEDSDFIQFKSSSKDGLRKAQRHQRGDDITDDDTSSDDETSISANHLTEPFSSESSSKEGPSEKVKMNDKKTKEQLATTPARESRKKALIYQKDLRQQLQNENNTNSGLCFEKVYLYIQMQLCRKDTLRDWLRTNCDTRDKTTIFDLFYQIVDAVEYVHSQDLIHRDLKPSNIFFSLDGTLKIGDFGLCRAKTNAGVGSSLDLQEYVAESEVERGFDAVHTEQVGTQLYMSPEQLNGLSYNQKVDIFAMGLILLELLIPFKTQMQRVNVLFKARNNLYSEDFRQDHEKEHELVKSLLSRSPQKRPTATEIKQHDLLSNAQLSQPVIERIYHRRRTISSNSSTE